MQNSSHITNSIHITYKQTIRQSITTPKAILAARSPELRNMIAMEVPTDKTGWAQPLQLLLPELKSDAARALLFFIYRDGLPRWAIGNSNLLASLMRLVA